MKTCRAVFCVLVVTLALYRWASAKAAPTQSVPAAPTPHVILRTLSAPVYSITVAIAGDAQLKVTVQPNGNIESITTISGPPVLVRAALESAQKSKFECIDCGDSTQSTTLTYSFHLTQERAGPCCCSSDSHYSDAPSVVQQGEHITITAAPFCICPDECTGAAAEAYSRYRSPKCFYLWRCGKRKVFVM